MYFLFHASLSGSAADIFEITLKGSTKEKYITLRTWSFCLSRAYNLWETHSLEVGHIWAQYQNDIGR